MSLLIIVASGHEWTGATSNRVFIESYWCLIWRKANFKVGVATSNRDAASNKKFAVAANRCQGPTNRMGQQHHLTSLTSWQTLQLCVPQDRKVILTLTSVHWMKWDYRDLLTCHLRSGLRPLQYPRTMFLMWMFRRCSETWNRGIGELGWELLLAPAILRAGGGGAHGGRGVVITQASKAWKSLFPSEC